MRRFLFAAVSVLLAASCTKGDEMNGIRAPEIRVRDEKYWINSAPLTMKELKGKIVLVDIWDYTCVNCIRTLPHIKDWYEKYKDKGLVIIGFHTPEFAFARERANVEEAVRRFGIKYPVVMDNDYEIWTSYANMYWPRKYLVDKDGVIRYDHAGEGGYEETEQKIQELLKQIIPDIELPAIAEDTGSIDKGGAVAGICYPTTPELYLGYERGRLGNQEGYKPGRLVDYKAPDSLVDGYVYARGTWRSEAEAMVHAREIEEPEDYIAIRYHAIEVNAVIKPEGEAGYRVYVKQDGEWVRQKDRGEDLKFTDDGKSYLEIKEPRMYRIVDNAEHGEHTLELSSTSDGFGIYAFTFGACTAP